MVKVNDRGLTYDMTCVKLAEYMYTCCREQQQQQEGVEGNRRDATHTGSYPAAQCGNGPRAYSLSIVATGSELSAGAPMPDEPYGMG